MADSLFLTPTMFCLRYGRIAPRFVRLDAPNPEAIDFLTIRSGAKKGNRQTASCVRPGFKTSALFNPLPIQPSDLVQNISAKKDKVK